MSKNLSFESTIKEDKTEEFFAFLKDYNNMQDKNEDYESSITIFTGCLVLLLSSEGLIYLQAESSTAKNILMCLMLFMFVGCFKKTIPQLMNNFIYRKQRKKDLQIMNEKSEAWLSYMKQKDHRFVFARNLIDKLEYLEKIKLENVQKEIINKNIIQKKETVYKLFGQEININDFDNIEEQINEIKTIENQVAYLVQEEKKLIKIKEEIHGAIKTNTSESFKDKKFSKSFS